MTLLTEKAEIGEGELLKTDTMGRVWTPRERREKLVAEYERSGMSGAEFAKWSGVKYGTFAGWVQKVRKARRGEETEGKVVSAAGSMRWAEAVCENPTREGGPALTIHLSGGIRVEARDGRVAVELLTGLGVRGC